MESQNKWSIQPQGGLKDRMKSRNVNEIKCRAHVTLAAYQEELRATQEKNKYVKRCLDYMRMVYHSVEPAGLESTLYDLPSIKSSNSILLNNRKIYHHDVLENINNSDANCLDKSGTSSLGQNASLDANKSTDYSVVNENGTEFKNNSNEKLKKRKNSREGKWAAPLTLEQSWRSGDGQNNNHDVIEPHEIFIMSPPATKCSEKSELIMKIASSNNSNCNVTERHKTNKLEKVSPTGINSPSNVKLVQSKVNKIGTIRMMKVRKRKPRMRITNSKNTAANRPPIITYQCQFAKKNMSEVKPSDDNSQLKLNDAAKFNNINEKKTTDHTWNEVVEIYHNIAVKNTSPSVVSSKQQFKLEELRSFESKDEPAPLTKITTARRKQNILYPTKNFEEHKNICEPPNGDDTCRGNQKELNAMDVNQHHGDCQHSPAIHPWYSESVVVKNYQQPTISSKLKRVNRCYFSTQVQLQCIPFVVGTSVTRSHNVGLNIQQVFSMMKHRQLRMAPNIKPAIIRKVGKSIDPKKPLTEQLIEDHGVDKRVMNSKQILRQETQQVEHETSPKPPTNYGDSPDRLAHRTQSYLLRERENKLNIADDDCKKYRNVTNNSSRIRNVLQRLHDQFRTMNEKYEKLQIKVERTNDPILREELAALDSELTMKEEEISAVMDLYREIVELKQQMKVFRENKNVVCITTHSNGKHSKKIGPIISSRRSRIPYHQNHHHHHHHHHQTSGSQKLQIANDMKGPMMATHGAGFLRQIQSLQQQFTAR